MAKVKLDEILSDHESDIRKAVADVLKRYAPELEGEVRAITKLLIRRIDYRTQIWTRVPDRYVDAE